MFIIFKIIIFKFSNNYDYIYIYVILKYRGVNMIFTTMKEMYIKFSNKKV